MIALALALALSGPSVAAPGTTTGSSPVSRVEADGSNPHPGQNGTLDAWQQAYVLAAWRYFENNFQDSTCLYNSVNDYPSTTMWDVASSIAAMVAAYEFELIGSVEFDQRMSCLLSSLNKMELYNGELPNKAYNTITLAKVNYQNEPEDLGVSAIDLGRLLTWLSIVKNRYPVHAEQIDRFVLRWRFCDMVDRGGSLYGAVNAKDGEGIVWLQEGRLGYEEYAANGFRLWGFDTEAASRLEPHETERIHGVRIAYDARDPATYGAHNYVVTEAFLLGGLELNWDHPDDPTSSDLWFSDRDAHTLAKRIYRVQERRFRRTGILTARTEHQIAGPPYFVYDTIYSDGVEWNTIADTGEQFPELAAVSTKAALGMSVLFDTPYTDKLAAAVMPMLDPGKGLYEGFYEANGERIDTLTANTNAIVLETLLYKVQGKLYRRDVTATSLWDQVPNGEYPGNAQCLPGTARDLIESDPRRKGRYEVGRPVAK
ncbi:MAG: DUF3131 domain-containing protein [Myxococcota bacterium]